MNSDCRDFICCILFFLFCCMELFPAAQSGDVRQDIDGESKKLGFLFVQFEAYVIEQSAELQTWAFVKIYSLEKYKSLKRYLSVICCINRYQWGREYAPFYFKGLPLNLEIRIFLILRRTPESWFIALLYSFCVKSVILLVLKFLLLRNVWKSCGPGLCKINFCICPNCIGENPVLMLSVPQSSHSKMFLSFDISLVSDTAHVYV